MKLIFKI